MNERIRELIEQAHEQKPVIVLDPETCQPTHKIGNGGVPMYHSELNPEKLAELIILECEKVAKDPKWYGESPSNGWGRPIRHVCKVMKDHFGVKE